MAILLLPILIPLIAAAINAVFGPKLGERTSGWLATLACMASFACSVVLFAQVAGQSEGGMNTNLFPWVWVENLHVSFGLLVDRLSAALMLIITGVGALIHLYSIGYMHGDSRFSRYFVYLNLFVAFMLVLVMGNNYLMMFVGWEGVGLCSYLLIGFWYEKAKNTDAARKAFVLNRIGDVGFIVGLLLMFSVFQSLNFSDVLGVGETGFKIGAAQLPFVGLITLLLLVGATGKSAQIPLLVWLPDAMSGPTPASALIHAATMVTAGIYMIVRSHVLFDAAPSSANVVALVGACTALLAGSIALRQYDIKKVLAYSTVSQLGFMVAAAGLGAYTASIFHLMTHAFFKALLFLAAGSVIHGMEHYAHNMAASHDEKHIDPQDMRNMGGLARKMPLTALTFLAGALSLAGLPPFSGFWSKDEIILAALERNPVVFALLAVTAVITAFYTGRQLMLVFWGTARTRDARNAQESGPLMTLPLLLLAILALVGGLLNFPGGLWLEHWLEPVLGAEPAAGFNVAIAILFSTLTIVALLVAFGLYRYGGRETQVKAQTGLKGALNRGWYLDDIYRAIFVIPFYALASFLARVFDLGGIDGVVNGIGRLFNTVALGARRYQSGFVRMYGLVMLFGVVAMLTWFMLSAR